MKAKGFLFAYDHFSRESPLLTISTFTYIIHYMNRTSFNILPATHLPSETLTNLREYRNKAGDWENRLLSQIQKNSDYIVRHLRPYLVGSQGRKIDLSKLIRFYRQGSAIEPSSITALEVLENLADTRTNRALRVLSTKGGIVLSGLQTLAHTNAIQDEFVVSTLFAADSKTDISQWIQDNSRDLDIKAQQEVKDLLFYCEVMKSRAEQDMEKLREPVDSQDPETVVDYYSSRISALEDTLKSLRDYENEIARLSEK